MTCSKCGESLAEPVWHDGAAYHERCLPSMPMVDNGTLFRGGRSNRGSARHTRRYLGEGWDGTR